MPKICDYATQHGEAGSDLKVRNQKKEKKKNTFLKGLSSKPSGDYVVVLISNFAELCKV